MSEQSDKYPTQLDPEMLSALMEVYPEYNIDLRERMGSAMVFDQAKSLQLKLLELRINKEDINTAWVHAQQTLGALDLQAIEQGLMGEDAYIKGEEVRLPKLDVDFSANIAMLGILDQETAAKRSLEQYLAADEAHGKFSGFTMKFRPTEEGTFIPFLAYQVSAGATSLPGGYVAQFATGPVGATEIIFASDVRLDRKFALINQLMTVCEDRPYLVNRLNRVVSEQETLGTDELKRASYWADRIVNTYEGEKQTEVEDAVADFMNNSILDGYDYNLRSSHIVRSPEPGSPHENEFYINEEQLFEFTHPSKGVVFLDEAEVVEGKVTYTGRRTAHVAFWESKQNTYVPVNKLEHFIIQWD